MTDQNNSKYEQQHSGDSFSEMMKERGLCKREKEMSYLKTLLIICPIFFISGIIDSIGGGGGLITADILNDRIAGPLGLRLQQAAGRSWKPGLSDQVF